MRRWSAYCPRCLTEFAATGVVHEPLIWALAAVTACPVHGVELATRCPACRANQPFLSYRARPGLCRHCYVWLGDETARRQASAADPQRSALMAEVVLGPSIPSDRATIAAMVWRALSDSGLALNEFCRQIGHAKNTVIGARSGATQPSIDAIADICQLLGWSVRGFLEGEPRLWLRLLCLSDPVVRSCRVSRTGSSSG